MLRYTKRDMVSNLISQFVISRWFYYPSNLFVGIVSPTSRSQFVTAIVQLAHFQRNWMSQIVISIREFHFPTPEFVDSTLYEDYVALFG